MRILGLVDDLFLIAKIEGALKELNVPIKILSAEYIEFRDFDYVIVDMENKDAFKVIEKFPKKSLCFGSHVKKELFERAKKAGCNNTYPRSVFFDNLPKILKNKK